MGKVARYIPGGFLSFSFLPLRPIVARSVRRALLRLRLAVDLLGVGWRVFTFLPEECN